MTNTIRSIITYKVGFDYSGSFIDNQYVTVTVFKDEEREQTNEDIDIPTPS